MHKITVGRYVIIILIILMQSYSCNFNNKSKISQSFEFREHVSKDKDSFFTVKLYYPNEKISSITNFKNGEMDGWEKSYYENGALEYKGLNKKGVHDSTWVWYYKDGTIKKTVNFLKSNSPFGIEINYYKDGAIKEFDFHKNGEIIVYQRTYSPNGAIEKEIGIPVVGVYNRNQFKIGDTLEMITIIGLLPHWSVDLLATEYQNGGKQHTVSSLRGVDFNNVTFGKRAIVRKKLNQYGNFKWAINIDFYDSVYNRKLHYNDTLFFKVSP